MPFLCFVRYIYPRNIPPPLAIPSSEWTRLPARVPGGGSTRQRCHSDWLNKHFASQRVEIYRVGTLPVCNYQGSNPRPTGHPRFSAVGYSKTSMPMKRWKRVIRQMPFLCFVRYIYPRNTPKLHCGVPFLCQCRGNWVFKSGQPSNKGIKWNTLPSICQSWEPSHIWRIFLQTFVSRSSLTVGFLHSFSPWTFSSDTFWLTHPTSRRNLTPRHI